VAELKNVRHERFAQEIVMGTSQRKAYRAAFPSSVKWKDETVDAKASALAKSDKVLIRVKELQEEATSKAVKTATQRKEWLSCVMDDECEDMQHRLKACDMLNRMEGEYTDKVQVNGKINNPMAGLTTEDLKKLIADD
jgi:phage terminase small subunit